MDLSSGGLSFFLKAHQKVEDLFGLVPPVQDITGLDQMRLSSRPMEIVVNQADLRVLEDQNEIIVISVEVAQGHDSFHTGPDAGNLSRRQIMSRNETDLTHSFLPLL